MTRDPKVDPIFGDVFRYGVGAIDDTIMYLRSTWPSGTWTGFDVKRGSITEGYASTEGEGWEFVENSVPYATGGLMPTIEDAGL